MVKRLKPTTKSSSAWKRDGRTQRERKRARREKKSSHNLNYVTLDFNIQSQQQLFSMSSSFQHARDYCYTFFLFASRIYSVDVISLVGCVEHRMGIHYHIGWPFVPNTFHTWSIFISFADLNFSLELPR